MSERPAPVKAQDEERVEEKKSGRKHTEPSLNMDELQALAALVNEHGFTDFEFENENIRVRLSKMAAPAAAPVQAASVQATSAAASSTADAPAEPAADPDAALFKITSPIVGTFYSSPGPDKDPYVSEGSAVTPESTVCIVEAMKLMNEIQAEVSGTIVRVYVQNGQPVEYGQPLFGVKK
jgi:acetyl-CoA carboxylase biotin carboxyl carrier protein